MSQDPGTTSPAALLLEFHQRFGLAMRSTPGLAEVPEDLLHLRGELLREEAQEYADAAEARDLIGVADALADVVYVAYGNALTYGIDLDAVLAEVHRSNMSKLDRDGRPMLREDGKVLKGPDYSPPNIPAVLGLPAAEEGRAPREAVAQGACLVCGGRGSYPGPGLDDIPCTRCTGGLDPARGEPWFV